VSSKVNLQLMVHYTSATLRQHKTSTLWRVFLL